MKLDLRHHLETTWRIFISNLIPLLIITVGMVAGSVITLGIMAPVLTAGYMQSLLLLIRNGRSPEIRDLISEMRLFWPLTLFTAAMTIGVFIGLKILVLPGLVLLAILFFSCLYMLPLMTDREMGITQAIRESYAMAMQKPVVDHLVILGAYAGLSFLGKSFILLTLFTQPVATLFILSVYNSKIMKRDDS